MTAPRAAAGAADPCNCDQALELKALLVEAGELLEQLGHLELCHTRDPLERRGCDCGVEEIRARIEEAGCG